MIDPLSVGLAAARAKAKRSRSNRPCPYRFGRINTLAGLSRMGELREFLKEPYMANDYPGPTGGLVAVQEVVHQLAQALDVSESDAGCSFETPRRAALSYAEVAADASGLPQTIFRDHDSAGWWHTHSLAGRLAKSELWISMLPSRYFA